MKYFQSVLAALLILFLFSNLSQAATSPYWSFDIKAAEFRPSSAEYSLEYSPSGLLSDLELVYNFTPMIGVGVSVGYFSGNGIVYSTSGRASALTQQLILIPSQFFLIYHFDFETDQLLVPYLGAGFTRVTYQHSVEGQNSATGGLDGYHARAGIKVLLDRIDPNSAVNLYTEWRIIHTYFVLEGQYSQVNNFGESSINLGGWSYFGGIQFDF